MSHDDAFAAFQARRRAAEKASPRVTWRRVSTDTGGGYSGLGPNGRLVWVRKTETLGDYAYGDVVGSTRHVIGTRDTLAEAKASAERLLRPEEGQA